MIFSNLLREKYWNRMFKGWGVLNIFHREHLLEHWCQLSDFPPRSLTIHHICQVFPFFYIPKKMTWKEACLERHQTDRQLFLSAEECSQKHFSRVDCNSTSSMLLWWLWIYLWNSLFNPFRKRCVFLFWIILVYLFFSMTNQLLLSLHRLDIYHHNKQSLQTLLVYVLWKLLIVWNSEERNG